MKTITEYLINNHVQVNKDNLGLAQALAMEIWHNCENNELDKDSFEEENSECVIFKPTHMVASDILILYNFFAKNYPQFKNINYINTGDCAYIGDGKTWIDIKCDFSHKDSHVSEIYLTLDVRDELIKQANQ